MQAVIFKEHGNIGKLLYTEVPTPKIGPEEALVRVRACALNHLDIWTLQGMPGVKIPLPHILGCDIAGEIAELGAKVKTKKVGTRVVVAPGISCGQCKWCKTGWDSLCAGYKIVGFQIDGGYAQYVRVPAKNLIPVSKRHTWAEWAASPLVFLTAYHMLQTRAQLKKGETVLIHAAGSGVGSAAIQVAKLMGARVLTTVGSFEKEKPAKKLGADVVINYTKSDFADEVKKYTKGEGADVVFEHTGAQTFTKSLASLSKKGRLVTCGVTSGGQVQLDLRFLFVRQHSILGSYMGGRGELDRAIKMLERGRLKPVVDSVFPLSKAAEAHLRMLERKNFGKIVLEAP